MKFLKIFLRFSWYNRENLLLLKGRRDVEIMRILIIEDDEQLCETLQLQFEHHGIEIGRAHV